MEGTMNGGLGAVAENIIRYSQSGVNAIRVRCLIFLVLLELLMDVQEIENVSGLVCSLDWVAGPTPESSIIRIW